MSRRNRKVQRTIAMPEINLTPLIDTALVLLVVFMVTAPMIKNGIKVDLPEGQSKEVKQTQEELVVYIDKSGQLFFNEKNVTTVQLLEDLKKSARNDKTVFVKADRGVNYGKVIEIVDQIKYVGDIKYVALATTPRT